MKLTICLLVATIAIGATSMPFGEDPVVRCTEDIRLAFSDLALLVESFEKDPFNPCFDQMKTVLASINRFLNECFNLRINLIRYRKCVDEL